MKKTYISPAVQTVALYGEENLMVNMSDATVGGNKALSDKKDFGVWSSESWSGDVAGDTEE